MRNSTLAVVLTICLAILIGIGYLYHANERSAAETPATVGSSSGTATQFYKLLNTAFSTGTTTSLRAALAPNFADHASADDPTANADGFITHIAVLRSEFPGMQLQPTQLAAQGELSVWRVHVAGAGSGSVLGLPTSADGAWSSLDLVRVRNGRIVERWGSGASTVTGSAAVGLSFALTKDGRWIPAIEQLTLAPGASFAVSTADTPWLGLLRSGELTVSTNASTDTASPQVTISGRRELSPLTSDETAGLGSNDLLLLPPSSEVTITNGSDSPSVLFIYTLRPPGVGGGAMSPDDSAMDTGISTETIASAPAELLRAGSYQLATSELTLPNGTGFPPTAAPGLLTMAVEAGAISIATPQERIYALPAERGTYAEAAGAYLTAGDGAVIEPGVNQSMVNIERDDAQVMAVLVTGRFDDGE